MTEDTLVLYHGLASTCSKKVRMCLYEKRLTFQSRLLDLQKFEQHSPSYLKLNPNGVVPTIVHNGSPIIESSVIIDYVDYAFPQHPLTPAGALDRAKMRLWMKYSDDVAYKAVYAPTWHHLRHRAAKGLSAEQLEDTLSAVPSAERRQRWAKMAEGGYSDEELKQAYDQMWECLKQANADLLTSAWLAGSSFSLADISMLPFVDRISNLRPEFLEGPELAPLIDWVGRCRQRESFSRAFDFRDDPRAAELPNF
jgi:glutathione S-transferase